MAPQIIIIPPSFLENDDLCEKLSPPWVEKLKEFIEPKNNSGILHPYAYYTAVLDRYNPAYFPYMEQENLEQLFFDLRIAYLLLAAKIEEENKFQKQENLAELENQKKQCSKAVDDLYKIVHRKDSNFDSVRDNPKNDLYLGPGQWLSEKKEEAAHGKTKFICYWIAQINDRRLYWVWGGSLLETLMERYLRDDFYNAASAKKEVASLHPTMGYLSFVLYYFRFGLNLFLLLKHTIKHPWMSVEEKKTPWIKRFTSQWDQRKFALINDSVWATANLAGFFWLVGSTVKDHSNNLLTVGLLVLDLSLAIWRYCEEETKYNEALKTLEENKKELQSEIDNVKALSERTAANPEEQAEIDEAIKLKPKLEMQMKNLSIDIAKLERDWKYTKKSLLTDIGYAFGLLLSFTFMTIPFIPVAESLALTFGVVGIAACFLLTAIYSARSAYIEISRIKANRKTVDNQLESLLSEWPAIMNEQQKKLFYLEIQDLQQEKLYANKLIRYQNLKLARSILIDAMMPAVIFTATVFMPMGIGIAVIAAAIGIALISKLLLNVLAQPKKIEKTEFNENEYRKFYLNPPSKHTPTKYTPTLFGSPVNDSRDSKNSESFLAEPDNLALGNGC